MTNKVTYQAEQLPAVLSAENFYYAFAADPPKSPQDCSAKTVASVMTLKNLFRALVAKRAALDLKARVNIAAHVHTVFPGLIKSDTFSLLSDVVGNRNAVYTAQQEWKALIDTLTEFDGMLLIQDNGAARASKVLDWMKIPHGSRTRVLVISKRNQSPKAAPHGYAWCATVPSGGIAPVLAAGGFAIRNLA